MGKTKVHVVSLFKKIKSSLWGYSSFPVFVYFLEVA